MTFPDFFAQAPGITLRDPLAGLLGSSEAGLLHFTYADAVRLQGHSCPAVAGAWLMVLAGLDWLYPDEIPERGGIAVALREEEDEGTAGVLASVATLITGAAGPGGFKGIGGRHARRGLLHFGAPIGGAIGLRRLDTGAGVAVDLDTGLVPHDPQMRALMPAVLAGKAAPETEARFALLWQDRVRRIFAAAGDPRLIHVYDWDT
ncbi:hypothetical protein [Pseudogemmobacter humi]|uniref:Formylmethanofuran dehydrogenase subunit E domain-containing protein n=1 Tax=Pseudogemmobacter humi TaxID=2483812 RepID=A0A3P5WHK7_9RHOB|nr:hypothetical protein [Pseudogemmobacter humi]VDC20242.1 hypothetical protein XINFAN_00391 [Pseudogemmobacter humi]